MVLPRGAGTCWKAISVCSCYASAANRRRASPLVRSFGKAGRGRIREVISSSSSYHCGGERQCNRLLTLMGADAGNWERIGRHSRLTGDVSSAGKTLIQRNGVLISGEGGIEWVSGICSLAQRGLLKGADGHFCAALRACVYISRKQLCTILARVLWCLHRVVWLL